MAGFFGLFNYAKEGPGVDPDEPQKGPIADFFTIVGSKFWKLITLNLMMILFHLPGILLAFFLSAWVTQLFLPGFNMPGFTALVENLGLEFAEGVTAADYAGHLFTTTNLCFMFTFLGLQYFLVGPAQAGFTYIMRNYSRHQPVFIWMDFRDTAKANWKQSLIHSIISTALLFLIGIAFYFYGSSLPGTILPLVVRIFLLFALLFYTMMQFYIYQMIITVDLKLKDIYRNALLFTFLRLPSNFGVLILCLLILFVIPFVIVWMLPSASATLIIVALYLIFFLSFTLLLINYQANRGIQKYLIDPQKNKQPSTETVHHYVEDPEHQEEADEEVSGEEVPTGAHA